ncbi:MAG: hypothetical protein GY874_15840 [Desulfobacteraceae bacterium]|nr:hypothetical protein [Desulfobacteraceae bacterium]
MKKWKCIVCGYIHHGYKPPIKCPVCGAAQKKFVLITDSGEQIPFEGSEKKESGSLKKWRCTVCGYIHKGIEPPEKCPVCGAGNNKFEFITVMVTEHEQKADKKPETPKKPQASKKTQTNVISALTPYLNNGHVKNLSQIITQYHGHPIAVHIPNGVLPLTFLFTLLAIVFSSKSLAIAAKCNMIFVCISMPVVILTGLIDWYNRFEGKMSKVFATKMVCAAIVTFLSLVIAIWWLVQPNVYLAKTGIIGFFTFLNLINLLAAAVAGWFGGKLVFK